MKSVLTTLLLCLPLAAFAATTITYDSGEVLTLSENEKVFVTTENNLFMYKPYPKSVQFKKLWPTTRIDRAIPTANPNPAGGHDWCVAHVPYELGFTFSDQLFERACDSNKDGVYGCGDLQFDASEDASVCPSE
jgi:hypothetical protein